MGILLVVFSLIIVIWMLIIFFDTVGYSSHSVRKSIKLSIFEVGVVGTIILAIYAIFVLVFMTASYDSYLNARVYYDNIITQYKGAITLYEDKAVALDMEKAAQNAFTDLRFSGYQNKMADFIVDLRKSIVSYNKTVIKKRIMDKNFFYNWYVIPPDEDMKTIDIISK